MAALVQRALFGWFQVVDRRHADDRFRRDGQFTLPIVLQAALDEEGPVAERLQATLRDR